MDETLARAFNVRPEPVEGQCSAERVDLAQSNQSVALPLQKSQRLSEDTRDLALIAERSDEPTESLEAVLQRLRKD